MIEEQEREYLGTSRLFGPILAVEKVSGVGQDEMVEVVEPDGRVRLGRVLEVSEDMAIVQVFEGTAGLVAKTTRVRFTGHPLRIPVSRDMLGRVFDYLARPLDGGPAPITDDLRGVEGSAINPTAREYPRDYIQTGISAIDGMNTLVRGQKLPIFSGSGLPHDALAAQIARQARVKGQEGDFAIIFAAMGVKHDTAEFFRRSLEESGVLRNTIMFLNLADDPPVERLVTPRSALTMAEFLAFEADMHVLVIMTDMTNYAEALREISSVRGELPSRKGYPGYLYSDLASIYERAGRIRGKRGSITQLPILTMPNDDINHPVPDLTGYITEGQIVLSRDLYHKGIYPPIDVLPSLSRLMKDGIGEGMTRGDHPNVASQLYAAYSRVKAVRSLAAVIGEEELSEVDKAYLKFGEEFERRFLKQEPDEDRSMEQTLDLAWHMLALLPRDELHRVSQEQIEKYMPGKDNPPRNPAAAGRPGAEGKDTGADAGKDTVAVR
ncbi:MAG TPA: V-type ATP synthase subunit B [Firmicutes bacterium]|nr:V-type ATP synthase subunit B [Bacillota bacterium]